MAEILKKLLAFLFPFYCLGCGKIDRTICDGCLGEIQFLQPKEEELLYLDGLWAAVKYEKHGLIAGALHHWKYDGQTEFSTPLFQIFRKFWEKTLSESSQLREIMKERCLAITYIPMHPEKLKKREFNQARELAEAVFGKELMKELLKKVKQNSVQMRLDAKARKENVKNIFEISADFPELPEKIILVDDVATTLSTLEEAAKTLKQDGVRQVFGLVLARQQLE